MTNGKKESVDGNVEGFLVRLSLAAYKMCTLHNVLPKESEGIAFKENFYLVVVEDAVLHGL